MHIIWTIIIGFVIGLLARFLMPGKDAHGFIVTTLLGVIGAFVATLLGQVAGFYQSGEPAGLIMSVFGALLILFVYKKFSANEPIRQS